MKNDDDEESTVNQLYVKFIELSRGRKKKRYIMIIYSSFSSIL
jgi:hypothetical protein